MANPKVKIKFAPAHGSPYSQKDADIIGPELYRIAEQNDGVTTKEILHEATNPASPLHRYFEWNGKKAANKYRLGQARRLARSVLICWSYRSGQRVIKDSVHALHFVVQVIKPVSVGVSTEPDEPDANVTRPKRQRTRKAYVRFDNVCDTPEYSQQLITAAKKELVQVRNKYQEATKASSLKQKFGRVWAAIDKL